MSKWLEEQLERMSKQNKDLAKKIEEMCKEWDLRPCYHHISDLLRKLKNED